ncbi:MAG: hypothetical protein CL731_01410 [Chloroflexi bacterium]|nr:hypothetical protein [Chloroflexota bacterium]
MYWSSNQSIGMGMLEASMLHPTLNHTAYRNNPTRSLPRFTFDVKAHRQLIVVGFFLISLLLIQCSGDEPYPTTPTPIPSSTPAPTPTSIPGPTATPFATPTSIPQEREIPPLQDPARGGFLKFAVPEGPPHYDPHLTVSSALNSWGAGLAYSRLLKFDTTNGGAEVICDLCESWQQSAPLTFRFQIRDDVSWHDIAPPSGRTLTAQDIAFSLNRITKDGSKSASLFSNISEISAVGDQEVVIRLFSPDSEALEKLADSHARIVSHETVETFGDLRRGPTVGTGPWIATNVRSDFTRLIANPDHYLDGFPYLDGLEIQVVPSPSVRAAGVRSKVIDLSDVNFTLVKSAQGTFDEISWVGIENPSAGVEIAMNTARSPLDSKAVREAMMLTWSPVADPSGYLPISNGTSSRPLHSLSSLGLPLIGSSVPLEAQFGFDERFGDIAKARSLLANAATAPTDNIVIKVGEYGDQYIDQAISMARGLADVGIRAEVERLSTRVFGDEVWLGGDYDIMVGAPPPVSSTTAYLFAVHHSNGPWNTTGYSNPEIDRLIGDQASEYDPTKRNEILVDIQKLILEGAHRFIATYRTTHWIFWDYVENFAPSTPRGDTDFLTRVWLNKDE